MLLKSKIMKMLKRMKMVKILLTLGNSIICNHFYCEFVTFTFPEKFITFCKINPCIPKNILSRVPLLNSQKRAGVILITVILICKGTLYILNFHGK